MHDEEIQNKRMREWYSNEIKNTMNSEYLQVQSFALNWSTNIENRSNKAIRKWIYSLRKIKACSEKYSLGDIRYYFDRN